MFIDRNVTKYHTPFEGVANLECAGLAALWPNVRDSFLGRKCFALYSQLRWQEAQAKAAPGRRTPN